MKTLLALVLFLMVLSLRGETAAKTELLATRTLCEIRVTRSHAALSSAAIELQHDLARVRQLLRKRGLDDKAVFASPIHIETPLDGGRRFHRLSQILSFEVDALKGLSQKEQRELAGINYRLTKSADLLPTPDNETVLRLLEKLDVSAGAGTVRLEAPTLRLLEKDRAELRLQLQSN